MPTCWVCGKQLDRDATTIRAAHGDRPAHRACTWRTLAVHRRTVETMRTLRAVTVTHGD